MRKEIMVMEWYVLNYNFNTKRIENFNIFRNTRFTEFLPQYVNGYEQGTLTYDQLKEAIRRGAKYLAIVNNDVIVNEDSFTASIDILNDNNLEILVKYILDNKEYLQK